MLSAAFAAFAADPITARRQFKALAEGGDPRAQAAYALMLAGGQGGGKDPAAAARWYHKAALQGHPVASYALAGMYLEGRGVPNDPELAREWYAHAAELGDRDALWMLGTLAPNPDEALDWWRRAAARGHAGARTCIGQALLSEDLAGGAEALLEAATAGDEDALQPLARVLPAVRAAAAAGSPGAAWVAAAFADDPVEAERLRMAAVDGGHGRACFWLAERVRRGEAPGGNERWVELLERAADGGCVDAEHELATACATGSGVERDPRLAAEWFRSASRWGRPASLHGLGASLLESGTEAERDEALEALRQASLAGDAPSMFLYAAQLVEDDRVGALRWLIEAAATGHADALAVAKGLAATLTPDDVRQADRATQTDGSVAEGLLG